MINHAVHKANINSSHLNLITSKSNTLAVSIPNVSQFSCVLIDSLMLSHVSCQLVTI